MNMQCVKYRVQYKKELSGEGKMYIFAIVMHISINFCILLSQRNATDDANTIYDHRFRSRCRECVVVACTQFLILIYI